MQRAQAQEIVGAYLKSIDAKQGSARDRLVQLAPNPSFCSCTTQDVDWQPKKLSPAKGEKEKSKASKHENETAQMISCKVDDDTFRSRGRIHKASSGKCANDDNGNHDRPPVRCCQAVNPNVLVKLGQPAVGGLLIVDPNASDPTLVPQTATQLANYRNTLLTCLNNARKSHGLVPLQMNAKLQSVAQPHTVKMAQTDTLFHNPNLVSDVNATGYKWTQLGENIAWISGVTGNRKIANRLCAAWLSSPDHRANILNPAFRDIGIGFAKMTNGKAWSTTDFGAPA